MTPEEFVEARKPIGDKISALRAEIVAMERVAEDCEFPENVREATPEDVKVGTVFWYKNFDAGEGWTIVEEVYRPSDPYKAYSAEDGCRYGIDGAFVRID